MSQLSLFGAAAREPALGDLEGLLAGNGHVVRRGDSARLSVVVEADWRVKVLAAQLSESFGLTADVAPAEAGTAVGTPWCAELRPIADGWTRGAVKCPPNGWVLDGSRLRWWCLSSGRQVGGMYTLALGASDEHAWLSVGSALAVAGVPGALVGPRADGPAYRVVGRRRLVRLLELVGDRPAGVPEDAWPALN
ncbi:MAG TPA: hypothetical protein VHV79_04605 [Mycobacteriales bacterium]|jgi:hypothetical protein|nr:hypothetical protein [Mycobacteriales bacterium]